MFNISRVEIRKRDTRYGVVQMLFLIGKGMLSFNPFDLALMKLRLTLNRLVVAYRWVGDEKSKSIVAAMSHLVKKVKSDERGGELFVRAPIDTFYYQNDREN